MNKKLLSILISIVMVGTMIAVPAFATESEVETETQAKELGVDDFTIVKGAEHQLQPEGDYDFSYKSSKASVASVDADGKVTAVTEGEATITITATAKEPAGETATETENGTTTGAAEDPVEKLEQEGEGGSSETPSTTPSDKPKTQDVKVTVIEKVDISCEDLTIEEDETGLLEPSVAGEDYTFSFKATENDAVIGLKEDGTVEGLKPGNAKVKVLVNDVIGAEKEVTITVESGNYDGYVFEIPDPMPAEFSAADFKDKNRTFAYKYVDPSDNKEKVTFDKSEVMTAFVETDDLTDKFLSGKIQVWEVYKYKKKTRNLMNIEDMTLTYGDDTVNLQDKALNKDAEFTFSSGDHRVVNVDSEGNIKTVASGEAKITVTCTDTKYYREQKKTIKVIVKKADQTIEGDSSVTKYVGDNYFDINASAKTPIVYNSSNKNVATVDKFSGKVTIKAAGTALITLDTAGDDYCYNSASKTIKVTVKKPYATTLSVKALSGKDKRKIRLTWKPVKGASKYQIYVYNTKKTVTIKTSSLVGSHQDKNGNFYYTHTKLKAGKTYKYKVRAISYSASGKAYYGPYSSAKSAKAKSR